MAKALLKIDHKIVHEWDNYVLTPIYTVEIKSIHTVAIMPNRTVVQGCDNSVYRQTYKHQNRNVVIITRAAHGSLSVRKMFRGVAVPQTN